MNAEITNQDRADWANQVTIHFAMLTRQLYSGDYQDEPGQVIGDLMTNLMHLCDDLSLDTEQITRFATLNYDEERKEESE